MSKFAERLDDVIQEGDVLTIQRFNGEDSDHLRIKLVTHNEEFGALKQVKFIDAAKVTPGKLIETIEGAKRRIVDAGKTSKGAQTPPGE